MIEFTIQPRSRIKKFFDRVIKRLDNPDTPLKKASLVMLRSIDRNFREEGRPVKWATLSPLTKALRRGSFGGTHKILQDTGRLKASISAKIFKDYAKVGTNLEYARLMQKGGMSKAQTVKRGKRTYNIKSHKVPARPFILFQREDIEDINKLFVRHVEKAIK